MTCEEMQAQYLAGDVDDAASSHLSTCPACRSARDGLDRLRRSLADPTMWEEPPEDLRERVVGAVQAEAAPGGTRRRERIQAALSAVAVVAAIAVGVLGFTAWQGRPDWEVELVPTAETPAAVATVAGWNTDTGTRMELEIEGLPPVDDGFYEVWLTDAEGRHISAGTFRESGMVTVWAGVRRADFPRIWITREPIDDDPGPSAVTVLDTEV